MALSELVSRGQWLWADFRLLGKEKKPTSDAMRGYAIGEDQSTEVAFGAAQSEFLPWFEEANIFRPADQLGAAAPAPSLNESAATRWLPCSRKRHRRPHEGLLTGEASKCDQGNCIGMPMRRSARPTSRPRKDAA